MDPAYRTISGAPLSAVQELVLLSCTTEDMSQLAEILNARSASLTELAEAIRAYTEVLRPFAAGDGEEAALIRMPVETRREARRLQNVIAELRLRTGIRDPNE